MTNRAEVVQKIILIESLLELLVENQAKNIVIGGSAALILHGLKLSRPVEDIDIIIYDVNEAQLKVLNILKIINPVNFDFGYNDKRVVKFEINGVKVDIIIVKQAIPLDLLLCPIVSRNFTALLIQSIEEVVKAKMSYALASKKGELDTYRRSKDFIDLLDLKNSNFNLY